MTTSPPSGHCRQSPSGSMRPRNRQIAERRKRRRPPKSRRAKSSREFHPAPDRTSLATVQPCPAERPSTTGLCARRVCRRGAARGRRVQREGSRRPASRAAARSDARAAPRSSRSCLLRYRCRGAGCTPRRRVRRRGKFQRAGRQSPGSRGRVQTTRAYRARSGPSFVICRSW